MRFFRFTNRAILHLKIVLLNYFSEKKYLIDFLLLIVPMMCYVFSLPTERSIIYLCSEENFQMYCKVCK